MDRKKLAQQLEDKFTENSEKFFSDLYRLDVNEKKVRALLQKNTPDTFLQIADLIFAREQSKGQSLPIPSSHASYVNEDIFISVFSPAYPALLLEIAQQLYKTLNLQKNPNSQLQKEVFRLNSEYPDFLLKDWIQTLCSLVFNGSYYIEKLNYLSLGPQSYEIEIYYSLCKENKHEFYFQNESFLLKFENSLWNFQGHFHKK